MVSVKIPWISSRLGMQSNLTPHFRFVLYVLTRSFSLLKVLFNGHWNEGAADFIGEEGEQAFSIYSRFANSLKHTSSFSKLFSNKKIY